MRCTTSTARRLRAKQMTRWSRSTSAAVSVAASASGDARSPRSASSSVGFQRAISRAGCGAPSTSITSTSTPVSVDMASTGFAIVADASRNCGAEPAIAQARRSRRSTFATCAPKTPR